MSKRDTKLIKVALIAYRDDLNVGGSLRVLETLARALDATRVQAHIVFTYGGPGPVSSNATVPVHFLEAKGPHDVAAWMRARRVMEQIDPDILHFHVPAFWLHAALMGLGYVKVAHFHGPYGLDHMTAAQRLLMRQMGKIVDASVCITRGMRRDVLAAGWATPDRTFAVYNGIECDSFEALPPRDEAKAVFGIPPDALVVGVVCRLAWYKGCRDAVRIIARMSPKWHLLFCGDGPMRGYLQEVAEQEGVAGRVHFAGMLHDTRRGYTAMDAFLFLSRLEPFGLVIAEAMAAGVPVFGLTGEGEYRDPLYPLVTSDNAIFLDRVHPGDHGSPEPTAIIHGLARQIEDYGRNPRGYDGMVERARQWVRQRFDASVQAEAMCETYELALGRPTDAPHRK